MAARFPSHSFDYYHQPQWPLEVKPVFNEDDDMSVLDEKILDPNTPSDLSATAELHRRSFDHAGHAADHKDNMWRGVTQDLRVQPVRHQSFPTMAHVETAQPFMRIDPAYAAAYTHPHNLSLSVHSGASTPTPIYESMSHEYQPGPAMAYQGGPLTFTQLPTHTVPTSAIPMSPQSSQGGWMSATSSDTTEPRSRPVRSPSYRAASPLSHLRSDGIRKKNARFEIPAERNLHNIDSLILSTNDETEKKELKQQKRLLRNRQAALDSRQRKKMHTEKLEQEKKGFNQVLTQTQEDLERTRDTLQHEREQRMHERHQFEHYIHRLEYERDEAIRTKTLETAELRKMNNILKGHVRDFERQGLVNHNTSDFSNDFSSFDHLGIDDGSWDDDFALISNHDFKMEAAEPAPRRESTPPAPTTTNSKTDMPFSWNAFYMCLLFGAFIASNSNSSTGASAVQASIPSLSDEYRAESANVLKAVLASAPESSHTLIPSHSTTPAAVGGAITRPPTTIFGAEMARRSSHHSTHNLDHLHTALTAPSRHQQESAAFSLSAASYNQLTNPDPDDDQYLLSNPDDATASDFIEEAQPKPSRLQTAYASMQEARGNLDQVLGEQLHQRSLLWERVPEKVLRDFRRMVEQAGGANGMDGQGMEG